MRKRLILMRKPRLVPGGIWWDLTQVSGQTVYDNTGQYPGQLGSTKGVDTNDPATSTQGLGFLGDDFVQFGTGIGLYASAPWSVQVCFAQPIPATEIVLAKCGGTTTTKTFQLFVQNGAYRTILRGATSPVTGVAFPTTPHVVTVTWDGTIAELSVGTGTPMTVPVGEAADEVAEPLTLGCRTASAPSSFLNGTAYSLGAYPGVALSAAQRVRNLAYLRSWGIPKGIII